jgi:hypothetical protein
MRAKRRIVRFDKIEVDRDEFERRWSAIAGRAMALNEVAAMTMERAASFFRRGNDATAEALRELGRGFEKLAHEADNELQQYIAADRLAPTKGDTQ